MEQRTRRRFSGAEREALLGEYERSGMTQWQFATRAGISVSCLNAWLRRAKAAEAVRFVELAPTGPAVPAPCDSGPPFPYAVRLPGGTGLEIASGFIPGEVAELLRLLRGP